MPPEYQSQIKGPFWLFR